MPENDYRLVIFDAPENPQAVRDLFRGVMGIHPTDAMQLVAKAPGILPWPLAEGETRELLDGLYELGIAAEAWRLDALPKLIPPRTIHVAACLPDGLRIGGLHGEAAHWVPWEKIDVIHAARIAADDEFRDPAPHGWANAVATGLNALILRRPPSTRPRTARAQRLPRNPIAEVHIVRRDPLIAFRAVEDQMNYAYLDDRLRPSAAENFPLFLADLCQYTGAAYHTPSTKALLQGDEAAEPNLKVYPSSQAMLDDTTLRLLWSWYRRDRDAKNQTSTDEGQPGE